MAANGGHHSASSHATSEPAEPPAILDEDASAALLADLEEARDAHSHVADDEWFYIFMPGGLWTGAHVGVANDKVCCLARKKVKRWCDTYSWPKNKGCTFFCNPRSN